MRPSNKEMQLKKTCQLYAYVLKAQNKEIPLEVEECIESYDYLIDCVQKLSDELENLTPQSLNEILHNKELPEASHLKQWWEMHQEATRLRKELFKNVE